MSTMNGRSAQAEANGNAHVKVQKEFTNAQPFFTSMRTIPTLSFTLQNILMSMGTMLVSFSGLVFTATVVLPLSVLRTVAPKDMLTKAPGDPGMRMRGKVVLIVGASRGIGMEVLKQYAPEPNTTVIAVSRDKERLENAVASLGGTPARIHTAVVDLSWPSEEIAKAVTELDEEYGPISHLYSVGGISNHLENDKPFDLAAMEDMVNVNVSGTVAVTMAMYERMKERNFGKICIVGSSVGVYGPANMIGYASTKAFLNTFSSSLRTLASANNVEVVTVEPGFIDTRMTKMMRGQGSVAPDSNFAAAEEMAVQMKRAAEKGGVSILGWPVGQSIQIYSLKGLNPICEDLGRWVSMKLGVAGKKIT